VFDCDLIHFETVEPSWIPPPREYATMLQIVDNTQKTSVTFHYIGGMNYDTVKEISKLHI
jgi:hypothetical protein